MGNSANVFDLSNWKAEADFTTRWRSPHAGVGLAQRDRVQDWLCSSEMSEGRWKGAVGHLNLELRDLYQRHALENRLHVTVDDV